MAPPNVIWITLDSVRADHTSIDGYERDTTPRLAALGDEGRAFRNCIAHSKATLGSSGSILTGLTPARHTLSVDGSVLPEGVRTVPERFSKAGYTTACLSRNSFVSSATELDRGFDRMQWLASDTIHEAGARTLIGYLRNLRRHSAGLTLDSAKHATPYLMNATAKRWLRDFKDGDDPFFFYLHYNEPHRPYYPPLSYIDWYADDLSMSGRKAAELALEIHYDLKEIIANGCNLEAEEWAALHAMYDAEIAYTDEMVGRLIDFVNSLNLGNTVVVVTADHGELFGEYGLLSHKYVLSDAVTRVPLVIRGLGDDLAVGSEDLIQHSDVMTTLLADVGEPPEDTVGVNLRDEGREFAVSQRGPVEFDDLYQYNPDFDDSRFHRSALTAIRSATHRYQKSDDGSELFALPDEETDVEDDEPEIAAELSSLLEAWLEEHGRPVDRGIEGEFSGAVERQLRDLGYMD